MQLLARERTTRISGATIDWTAERLEKYVDDNTICVVAIAGQTFTAEDDDLQEIHDWLDNYEYVLGIGKQLSEGLP